MQLSDCFEMLESGNKGIQNADAKLFYFIRVKSVNFFKQKIAIPKKISLVL